MRIFCVLIMVSAFLFTGCSGGVNPISPMSREKSNSTNEMLDDIPIIAMESSEDGSFNAIGMMGAYELDIDTTDLTADLVSKRISSLGESWIVSGIGFFTVSPCADCLKVDKIALTADNNLQLTFAISHPFDPGVTTKPPNWLNRLDLDVFDVALVIVPVGATATNYPLTGAKTYTGILTNNAGYTTELANVVRDTAAMPYALVMDDNAVGANTYNEFPMGADAAFDVFFDITHMTSVTFNMYLTMGYGWSAKKADRLHPRYCNPEFNRKPSWKVKVTPPNGSDPPSMSNTWNDIDGTTLWDVTVEVFDWQIGAHVDPNFTNTTDIYAASDVSRVTIEIPGMKTTLPSATTPTSGTGAPNAPLVFVIPIANQNLLAEGEYLGLVKVSDKRVPPTPIADRDYLIDVPDGVTMTNFAIPEYATYQTFIAAVVSTNAKPVAIATATTPTTILMGESVTFDASASYDPDGMVTLYEWDFNEDGIFGGTGDEYTGASWNPVHVFPVLDPSVAVQLRVTDNLGKTDKLDSPIIVSVAQSKGRIFRPGIDIEDLTVIKDTNEVLIMFVDSQVWKYDGRLFNGAWLYTMPGTQSNQRVEANNNGDSICAWWSSTERNSYSYLYDGTLATTHGYTTLEPRNSEQLIIGAGSCTDCQADLTGYYPGIPWVWMNRFAPPNYINVTDGTSWDYDFDPGPGAKHLDMDYVKGSTGSNSSPQVVVLEGAPEWRVEKINTQPFGFLGSWWGGTQTDADTGFWNPQDITSNSQDNVLVLDILSTGLPKVKKFTWEGASLGSFGTVASIPVTPTRIEASWSNNWVYVVMADRISIFLPGEQP